MTSGILVYYSCEELSDETASYLLVGVVRQIVLSDRDEGDGAEGLLAGGWRPALGLLGRRTVIWDYALRHAVFVCVNV